MTIFYVAMLLLCGYMVGFAVALTRIVQLEGQLAQAESQLDLVGLEEAYYSQDA